jgi:hypothetical protein
VDLQLASSDDGYVKYLFDVNILDFSVRLEP